MDSDECSVFRDPDLERYNAPQQSHQAFESKII